MVCVILINPDLIILCCEILFRICDNGKKVYTYKKHMTWANVMGLQCLHPDACLQNANNSLQQTWKKGRGGSYGEGIYLCENKKAFVKIMEFISSLNSSRTLIVQEYVDARPGEDLRVFVIGSKVIGVMKRHAPDGDFRANISNGGYGEPFEVTSEIDYLAREAARICGLHIAGIDLLFDKDGYKICEANSAPGFEGFEKYCQVDVAARIAEYIKYKIGMI